MKKKKKRMVLLAGAAAIGAGVYYMNRKNEKRISEGPERADLRIPSERGTEIPVTVYRPSGAKETPLAVFIPGFNDDRESEGRFTVLAEVLLKRQITSVLFDHAGNGESSEGFEAYCLRSSLSDLDAIITYMKANYAIDNEKIVLIGYSMGGREAVIYAGEKEEIRNLILLAPALSRIGDGEIERYFGGADAYAALSQKAADNGFAQFRDGGRELHISQEFFRDMKEFDPLQALGDYSGNLLFLQGNEDETVTPEASGKALQYLNPKARLNFVYLDHMDHAFRTDERCLTENIVREYIVKKL